MPLTPAPLSLPYPSLSDPPDGAGAFANLALRINTIIGHDSGWIQLTANSVWDGTNDLRIRRVGQVCTLVANPITDTTTVTATDVYVVNLAAEFRPQLPMAFPVLLNNNATAWGDYNSTDFNVRIKSLSATGTHTVRFSWTYVTAFPSS